MALYFGKIGKTEQLDGAYYAGGDEGNSWYGGIRPGDYVFPIVKTIDRLWKVKEYTTKPNPINLLNSGVVTFETIRNFNEKVPLACFIRYKHFNLDLDLLNKVAKSVNN